MTKPMNEVKIDNVKGAGSVPYNQEVDYFGLRVTMKPSTFLSLAAPLNEKDNSEMEEYIRSGGAIGAPFLDIAIPKEWDDGDFTAVAKIQGHEGRHRMRAIMAVEGDNPIEVHLFPKYYRARDLTPEFVKHINAGLYAEKSSRMVRGPLFNAGVVAESDTIKLTPPDTKVTDFINAVYTKYPQTFQNNHVMPLGGTGDDQQFAMFELTPSFSRRGAVEVKWIQAYPLRQGVGGRAMQELQALAKDAGIALTLFPWDKGVVSQAKLTKFYKGQGFKPTVKGAKNMAWTPESLDEAFDQPYAMTWEKSEADDSMDALARLPDGSNLSIMFNMEYDEEGEEVIQVEFHRNNSQEVTGDGDAQRVFATVLAAIQQYIKVHNPKRLTFSASKEVEPDQNSESRAKLYDRLVIRYARTWGYRPLRADTGSIVRYELSRIKPGVVEGLTEARNSLFAFVKQHFPSWPDYVLKDFLYAQAKGIRDQAELDDFLKRNKQDFGNCKWTLTKLPITFDIFTPKTQRMLASREGGSSNPFQVPRDAERHAQQSQMIQQKGVSAEPIIVAKLSNGYDLIEGWHRTIQHLKTFPEGYTGPAWICTGATYTSESVEQGVAEGLDEAVGTDTEREVAQAIYMEGRCGVLAIAINQANPERYKLGYIYEYNVPGTEDMYLDPDDFDALDPEQQQQIKLETQSWALVHAYVVDQQTKEYIDARGRHSKVPDLNYELNLTRKNVFPATSRDIVNITADMNWNDATEEWDIVKGLAAWNQLGLDRDIPKALDYAVKYLNIDLSKGSQSTPKKSVWMNPGDPLPPSSSTGTWVILGPYKNVLYRFSASTEQRASAIKDQWCKENNIDPDSNRFCRLKYDGNVRLGQPINKQGVAEGKVKLYTDPGYFGAEVDDAGFDSLPVVNISADRLVGFEPDSKMNQPKSQANVKKIVAGLKKGDKLPPLLVRKYKNGYQVLDGHHRFWAYKLLGTTSIPVRIVADKDIEEIKKQGVAEAETGTAHADQIEKEFTALGYKLIGSGADSTVWAKNKGHIIKILMPEAGGQAEQVFTKFYEFCLAHQDLECLPVINEHNKISVLDREYTQIDMERLSHIKKNSFNEGVVWFFSDFVAGGESWGAVDHALGLSDTWTEYNPRQAANLAKYWQDMTFTDDNSKYKELHTLYGVMQILYKAGRINKFGWDLHTDNVMQRKNGQLVIIDPWFADSALTESVQLPEARTNPEQNTRPASGMKELQAVAKTLGDIKNWAISMTAEPKLGINPQVGISEDTPKGIYFYPLDYALGLIQRRQPLPWGNNLPYIQLFQYDRSGEMTKETQVDSDKLKQALRLYCSEEVIQSAIDEPEYDGTPYWFIYDCLSRLGKSDETNIVRWNKVLRDLGFTSVYDDGHGWIAYNEPTQGVVLDPRVIKQLRTIDNKKESGVITPALIEQTLFDNLDVELAGSRAWQAWDPDGSKLRQHCKEWAKSADFKPWLGKDASAVWDETQKLVGLIGYYRRTVGREINNQAWEWYRAQQAQKTESIAEGGWASAATQNTVITPAIIVEVVAGLNEFAKEYNTWQAQSELGLEIRMGKPKGSGTYYERDLKQDPTREYGDIDIECFIHSRPGASSAQLITQYKNAIAEFTRHNRDFASDNGTNIIMTTSAGPAQVDLIYTFNEHADWSRALSPEYRVKGVISTSLTSALAEVLNFSFSSQGVQVKTRAGRPVSFRQSKDTELTTVTTNPDSWARDMFQYYYTLANGQPYADRLLDLDQHPGLKDEQRLADIVHSIRSLATELERNNLLGNGALDHVADAQTLLTQVSKIYAQKLEAVISSSKFDKAATPAAEEKAKKTKLMLAKYRNEVTKLLLN